MLRILFSLVKNKHKEVPVSGKDSQQTFVHNGQVAERKKMQSIKKKLWNFDWLLWHWSFKTF